MSSYHILVLILWTCPTLCVNLIADRELNLRLENDWDRLRIFPSKRFAEPLVSRLDELPLEDASGSQGVIRFRQHADYGAVAVKEVTARFDVAFREIEILRALNAAHVPHVVRFIRAYRDPDRTKIYIVSAFAGQRNADDLLRDDKTERLGEADVARNIARMLRVLKALRHLRIVHRDIKPANLVLDDDSGEFVLIDFGMAVFENQIATFAGSPCFTAPEVQTRKSQSFSADIWSVGATMMALLGHNPLGPYAYDLYRYLRDTDDPQNEEVVGERVTRALVENVQKEMRILEDVPDDAQDLARQMLDPSPKRRISARDALHHRWFATHGVGASSSTPPLPESASVESGAGVPRDPPLRRPLVLLKNRNRRRDVDSHKSRDDDSSKHAESDRDGEGHSKRNHYDNDINRNEKINEDRDQDNKISTEINGEDENNKENNKEDKDIKRYNRHYNDRIVKNEVNQGETTTTKDNNNKNEENNKDSYRDNDSIKEDQRGDNKDNSEDTNRDNSKDNNNDVVRGPNRWDSKRSRGSARSSTKGSTRGSTADHRDRDSDSRDNSARSGPKKRKDRNSRGSSTRRSPRRTI